MIYILKLVKSWGLSVDLLMCILSDSRQITKVLIHNPRCACKHYKEGSKQFTTTQMVEQCQQMFQLMLQVRRTCCSWACTTPSQTTVPCCPPGRRVQRGRRRGSTSAVITWWATKPCAGTPSNSSTSKYSALANNHCSITIAVGG